MTIQQLSIADAITRVNSTPEGLSPAEAKRLLREFGPNRIEPDRDRWVLGQCLDRMGHCL